MSTVTKTKLEQATELVDTMSMEELDTLIDHIRTTYKARRSMQNAHAKSKLKVGDRVKLVGNLKPKYLIGMTGTIEEKKDSRVVVLLTRGPVGKFHSGRVVASASSLEVMHGKN